MKKYMTPSLKESLFKVQDVISASGDTTNSIVSDADKAGSNEIQESIWDDSWN